MTSANLCMGGRRSAQGGHPVLLSDSRGYLVSRVTATVSRSSHGESGARWKRALSKQRKQSCVCRRLLPRAAFVAG